jgi:hypothetical protein
MEDKKITFTLPKLSVSRFWTKWVGELTLVAVAVLIWLFADDVIELMPEPDRQGLSNTYLQKAAYAMAVLSLFSAFVLFILGLRWSKQDDYLEGGFNKDFEILTGWQKIKVVLFLSFALLLLLVLLTLAM